MKNLNKLDVAAKVFPSISNKNYSAVFRMSVILKEEIDEHILQLAVNMIYHRYRLFFLKIRRGFFWDYFDKNYNYFTVQKESEAPCSEIKKIENNGFGIKVLYYKNRISVEAFHSITDGAGIVEFMKSLVYYYICIKHGNIDSQNKVLLFDEVDENDSDSFEDCFGKLKKIKSPNMNKQKHILNLNGEKYKKSSHSVITGVISVNQIKEYCKKNSCTITECLIANMIFSIYQEKLKGKNTKKSIVITVPVNLRKSFGSNTLKNFFVIVKVGYKMDDSTKFSEVLSSVTEQMKEYTKLDYLQKASWQNLKIANNPFSKYTPLFFKNIIIPIGVNFIAEQKKTITISNIGKIDFPDAAKQYIEHAEMLSYSTKRSPIGCTVCSFEDKLCISFTKKIKDNSVVRSFYKHLVENTLVDVTVYSNMWGDEYE